MVDLRDTKVNFKLPLYVKIGLLVAFFVFPLPVFIVIAVFVLYYGFFLSVKAEKQEESGSVKPLKKERFSQDSDEDINITQEIILPSSDKAVVCPRCDAVFSNGKPQVCHLSNCYYERQIS